LGSVCIIHKYPPRALITMEIIQAAILALVQGITEWLPVSSSAHLLIAQSLLGAEVPVSFDVVLHIGTLAAVAAVFWRDILGIASAVVRLRRADPLFKVGMMIILGSIPTAAIGYLVSTAEASLLSLTSVGCALVLTSIILFASRAGRGTGTVGAKHALLVGAVQGIAVIPGISRSGSTISAALLAGVGRDEAFRYSMLLSIPAILGATMLKAGEIAQSGLGAEMLLGMVIAAVVGYASIRALRRTMTSGRFHLFGAYCLVAGLAVVAYSLIWAGA